MIDHEHTYYPICSYCGHEAEADEYIVTDGIKCLKCGKTYYISFIKKKIEYYYTTRKTK